MINIVANSGKTAYGVQKFILDTPADLNSLKTHYTPGSTAYVISTSQEYMLNNKSKWVPVGSEPAPIPPEPDENDTYIYDGGDIEDTVVFDGTRIN